MRAKELLITAWETENAEDGIMFKTIVCCSTDIAKKLLEDSGMYDRVELVHELKVDEECLWVHAHILSDWAELREFYRTYVNEIRAKFGHSGCAYQAFCDRFGIDD